MSDQLCSTPLMFISLTIISLPPRTVNFEDGHGHCAVDLDVNIAEVHLLPLTPDIDRFNGVVRDAHHKEYCHDHQYQRCDNVAEALPSPDYLC